MADTDDDTITDTLEAVFSPFKDIQRKVGAEEKKLKVFFVIFFFFSLRRRFIEM